MTKVTMVEETEWENKESTFSWQDFAQFMNHLFINRLSVITHTTSAAMKPTSPLTSQARYVNVQLYRIDISILNSRRSGAHH